MKIPDKINIAGKQIDVIIDNKYCNINNAYGRVEYDRCRIYLDDYKISGVHKDVIEETFIHECLHMINNILGQNDDEATNKRTSELLYQVIKQI